MIVAEVRPFTDNKTPWSDNTMNEKDEMTGFASSDRHEDSSTTSSKKKKGKLGSNGKANPWATEPVLEEEDEDASEKEEPEKPKKTTKKKKKTKTTKTKKTKKTSTKSSKKSKDEKSESEPEPEGIPWGGGNSQDDDSSSSDSGSHSESEEEITLMEPGGRADPPASPSAASKSRARFEMDQLHGSQHSFQIGYGISDDVSVRSQQTTRTIMTSATSATATPAGPLVETHVAVRVMKGEIHNVLTTMRSSDSTYISSQRFSEELTEESHPLVSQFQELHVALTEWDLRTAAQSLYKRSSKRHNYDQSKPETPESLLYLPPFCSAISTREINAPVTGACLTALHKFLLYGLVHPARDAKSGMTLIARALLHCTFEETSVQQAANQRLQRQQLQHQQSSSKSVKSNRNQSSNGSVSSNGESESQGTRGAGNSKSAQKSAALSNSNHTTSPYYHPTRVDDEQVVLKLLDLAAMVVRCSFLSTVEEGVGVINTRCLIDSDMVVGLLETCLHVSHIAKQASPLLKSAATDALRQIVLQVFGNKGTQLHKPREKVLAKLASLLDPSLHGTSRHYHHNVQDADAQVVVVSSLTAVNIALETSSDHAISQSQAEVAILQNDLCKYLLQWSTTTDLHILSLTLRVIFNLFQSIQNHLKVPLEVFLTSVHLRILDSKRGISIAENYEEREVVLESILEFCQEPALVQDIYRNYDCDVACTNLYEMIVETLGKTAMPNDDKNHPPLLAGNAPDPTVETVSTSTLSTNGEQKDPPPPQQQQQQQQQQSTGGFFAVKANPAPITQLNKLAVEGLLAICNSIARRVHADKSPFLQNLGAPAPSSRLSMAHGGDFEISFAMSVGDLSAAPNSGNAQQLSEEELQQRRQRKASLVQVAEMFNEDFMGHGWLDMAVNLDVLDSAENAKGVAEVLYSASGLDKAKVGIYLSKGPETDYPFQTKVRHHFVASYDFTDMPFAAGLRLFLSKFRLPGEAQCIDRFMEAFSNEFYEQQGGSNSRNMFKDADAVYVLSFSTIMLNTDLHNPTIKEENRMTKEQFIKNNRGINGGDDLPSAYLSELYDQIKEQQIQVQREVGEFMKKQEEDEDFRAAWDSILAKHREVAAAFFTPAGDARRNVYRAGMHDKEMFQILCKWAMVALPAIFKRCWDDAIVFRALRGLKQMAMTADHFGMGEVVNEIIDLFLTQGRMYVDACIAQDHNPNAPPAINTSSRSLEASEGEDETTTYAEGADDSVPYSLLSSGKGYSELDFSGAAHHRGLLALDAGFNLVRRYARKVTTAWPIFIACLCAMRDAKALPAGLSDLDDFADANGNVLPLSPYARVSQRRLDHYYAQQTAGAKAKSFRNTATNNDGSAQSEQQQQGWFTKLWKGSSTSGRDFGDNPDHHPEDRRERRRHPDDRMRSESTMAVLAVAESANVEKIVQMGSTKLPVAEQTIRSLLDVVDDYPYDDNPVAEQHAIFSLELAARALLSNRDRAVEIFPVFLSKFESVLGKISGTTVPSPFVIERIVVTILRCSIHLYDITDIRPNLRVSLHLLVMSIPREFIRDVADRMACGLAIILRASFPFFESYNEWTFMGDTLDTLANFASARVFVFDGIASTVECSMPQKFNKDRDDASYDEEDSRAGDSVAPQYPLTKEACGALSRILIRFTLGFYQGDFSLSVPASVCLEKLYYQMNSIILDEQAAAAEKAGTPYKTNLSAKERRSKAPNTDYWQNVAVALYSVCRSPDPDVSRHGYEICQRVILRTSLREIPAQKWLAVLYLMVNKQPPTAADLSRANTFVLLGNTLMRVLPYLSNRQRLSGDKDTEEERKENTNSDMVDGEDLTDLIRQMSVLAGENLRHGRRGRVSPLFEKTLQTVTYLSNHMQTDDWKGDKEFGMWASETLLAELEKVGAAGYSLQNQNAVAGQGEERREEDDP